jgi:hypothetical protein
VPLYQFGDKLLAQSAEREVQRGIQTGGTDGLPNPADYPLERRAEITAANVAAVEEMRTRVVVGEAGRYHAHVDPDSPDGGRITYRGKYGTLEMAPYTPAAEQALTEAGFKLTLQPSPQSTRP